MMLTAAVLFILFGPLAQPADAALGGDTAAAAHVQVRLVSEQTAVAPGARFTVGLHFKLEDGWHLYWQYPGDSGQAPTVTLQLPDGFAATPIDWPTPQRLAAGPLMNYGYSDAVLLPVDMQAADGWSDAAFDVTASIRWLVCAHMCIPGSATLHTSVRRAVHNEPNPAAASLFATGRARLPTAAPADWDMSGTLSGDTVRLRVQTPHAVQEAFFIPHAGGQIDNAAPQNFAATPDGFTLEMQAVDLGQAPKSPVPPLRGLVVLDGADNAAQHAAAYSVDVPLTVVAPVSLGLILLSAFVGGILLNFMPCVFPVLSLKILGFVQMAGHHKKRARRHAWLYAWGVVVSFWLLTGALLTLRYAGQQIGWGFQLQSPRFVVLLASVLFAFGLNLLGVFELGGGLMGAGQSWAAREGGVGAFFTGVLATVVATPCTAPFMGSAVGFALSQPPATCLLIFSGLASGLAFPYVALAHVPGWGRYMPRPGAWMATLRHSMGFLLFATVIWMVWVVMHQVQPLTVVWLLADFLLISIAAWAWGRWPTRLAAQALAGCLALSGVGVGLWQIAPSGGASLAAQNSDGLPWEAFSPERVAELRHSGRPVLLNFTAAWCVSCQVNEALVFESEAVRQKIKNLDIRLVKADWTHYDPRITQTLASLGRNGVPVYVLYGAGPQSVPQYLPEALTAGMVIDALDGLGR